MTYRGLHQCLPIPAILLEISMPQFTQGHALVIGVGDYQDKDWSVPVTAADAEGVADALKNEKIGADPTDHVRLLRNQETTRDGVRAALENWRPTVSPRTP